MFDEKQMEALRELKADVLKELEPLRSYYPGKATRGLLGKLADDIVLLEVFGLTHFGGPDVIAWWLVLQARKDIVHKDAGGKWRDNRGKSRRWCIERIVGYVDMLKAERRHEAEQRGYAA